MKKILRSAFALMMAAMMMLACASTAFAAGSSEHRGYRYTTDEYVRLTALCDELASAYELDSRVKYADSYNTLEAQIKTSQNRYETPIWDYLSRSTQREITGMTAYQAALKIRESAEYKNTSNSALRRQVDTLVAYMTNTMCTYLREPLAAFYPSGTLLTMDVDQLINLGYQVINDEAYWQMQDALDHCFDSNGAINRNLQYMYPDDLNAYYADISEALLTFWLPSLSLT